MKKLFFFLFLIPTITFLLLNCKSNKLLKNNKIDWVETKARDLYSKYEILYNVDSSFVIVKTDNKQSDVPNFQLKFSVLNVTQKKLVLEKTMDNTKLRWISAFEIETITQLGYEDKKTGKSNKTSIIILK
jgi:5-methylcytosine-specific restriction endonuclease McrBC GTP-binding regulatory subunit McrB